MKTSTTTKTTGLRRLVRKAVGMAAIAAAVCAMAAPAGAVGGYSIGSGTWNIRTGWTTNNSVIGTANPQQLSDLACQVPPEDGGQTVTVSGYGTSGYWDRVRVTLTDGRQVVGYMPDLGVKETRYAQATPGIPRCRDLDAQPQATARATGQKVSSNLGYSGQCTWGALEQWKARAGYYPRTSGNAKDWAASARSYGWTVVADAEPESIVVFQPGVQGADRTYGHVGYVTSVQQRSDGRYITFIEMNGTAGPGKYDTRTVKDIAGMSYILRP